MKIISEQTVSERFESYPDKAKLRLHEIRDLIFKVADESQEINEITETLKWNEPAYLTKVGSTIRIDWKEKSPNQVAVYFKCTSKLVPTFREKFGSTFDYEKNRALIFKLNQDLPTKELKLCIKAALLYHRVKGENDLGISSQNKSV